MAKRAKTIGRAKARSAGGDPRKRAQQHPRAGAAESQVDGHAAAGAELGAELEEEVAAALESGHPFDIVMLASSLIASLSTDPGQSGQLESGPGEFPDVTEFVRMFLNSGDQQLQTFAWTIAELVPDVLLRAEADRRIEPGVIPGWLLPLRTAKLAGAWQLTDALQDSSDIAIAVQIGELEISLIGLISLNVDGLLTDCFAVAEGLAGVQQALQPPDRVGVVTTDLSLGDARAWLSHGIAVGDDFGQSPESDTWPHSRPLLEWALRKCPAGGKGWQPAEISALDVAQLVADFGAGPDGVAVGAESGQAQLLLSEALWTLAGQTKADPMLLSASRLQIGLTVLWPTVLHQELRQLATLPKLLSAYVKWAHVQRGIPAEDTDSALATIAHCRGDFVRKVIDLGERD